MFRAVLSLKLLSKFSVFLSSLVLLAALPVLLSGASPDAKPLLIAAAADLAPLEKTLTDSFRAAANVSARFVLGSSGMLARQIEQGAPYDAYLSANEEFVRRLVESGHLDPKSVRIYAYGRLGMWSKKGNIRSLEGLLDAGVRHISIANPAHAPYGMAAREALTREGLWEKIRPKLIYGENVRQAFQLAESGNADAVITSWTLLFDKGGIILPESWHSPIRQAGGVVISSGNRDAALRFLEFLTGEEGKKLLERQGLTAPTPSGATGRKRPASR